MAKRELPPPEVVRQTIKYEPETGRLFWLKRPVEFFKESSGRSQQHGATVWNATYAGKEAFTAINSEGYCTGALFRIPMRAHRIAWVLMSGAWPTEEIDHINGIRHDNRWQNLREASPALNRRNQKLNCRNKTGLPGVKIVNGKFEASINVAGKSTYLGRFTTLKDAAAARLVAMAPHGFHPNHGR